MLAVGGAVPAASTPLKRGWDGIFAFTNLRIPGLGGLAQGRPACAVPKWALRRYAACCAILDSASRVGDDTLDEIHEAARLVMLPAEISDARLRLTSVVMNGANAEVEWSIHCNWSAPADGVAVTMPSSAEPPAGASVLITEIELDVSGVFDFIPNATRTLTEVVYSTPREVSKVALTPANLHASYACPFQAGS